MSTKLTIVEGNSNDKDNVRVIMVKGEQGYSAYDLYVQHGGTLTEAQWLDEFLNAENFYNKGEVDNSQEAQNQVIAKKPYFFNNVADMKAYNLQAGDTAITLGYYSANDGGGAKYKITNTSSNTEYQENLNNSLYATLVFDDVVSTKQLGLTGNENDTTSTIQKIINILSNKNGTLLIVDGTYKIDGTIGIQMKSNVNLKFINAKFKCIPNDLETPYSIIYLDSIENCIIDNLCLEGDRNEHLGNTGEYGFGLYFNGNTKNIIINNANLSNFWGDAILLHRKKVNNIDYVPNNLTFNGNINISNCRRQGISILAGENILIDNLICTDIDGTNPRACIDLESENIADRIGNIRINYIKGIRTNKCFSMRNRGEITGNISVGTIEQIDPVPTISGTDEIYTPAFRVFFEYFSENMKKYKITVDNVYQSRGAIEIENSYDITPIIIINNLYTKVREITARATPSTSRGIINLLWNIDTDLSNTLGNIIINNFIINDLRETANTDVGARPYIINYQGNKTISELIIDNVNINIYVNNINSHVTITNSASNILFGNVNIKIDYNNKMINKHIIRKNTGAQNQIIEDLSDYYFIPVDDGTANKTLHMRVLNSLKYVKLFTKGVSTININTIYNTTYWEKVFLNDSEITGTDGVYPLGQFNNDTEFIITTKDKNIYVQTI